MNYCRCLSHSTPPSLWQYIHTDWPPARTSHVLLELAATQGLFPCSCSHQPYSEPAFRAVSPPPICLWIKKAQLQVGDGLSSALYTVTSLWKGSPLGQARNCTRAWSVQCCPQAPCASWQLHSTCKQPHQPCGPCSVVINKLKKLSVRSQPVLKGMCCVRWSLMSYLPGTNGNVAATDG